MARYVLPSPVLSLPLLLGYTVSYILSQPVSRLPTKLSVYLHFYSVSMKRVQEASRLSSAFSTLTLLKGNAVEDDGDLSASAMYCSTDMLDRAGTSQHSVKATIQSHRRVSIIQI